MDHFFSTVGTFLFLLSVVSELFLRTNSVFISSVVFPSQWFLSFVFMFPIGRWCNRGNVTNKLFISEIMGSFLTLLSGIYFLKDITLLFLLLSFRGVFDSTTKGLRTLAIKKYFKNDERKKVSSYINSSYYLGIGVASILAPILMQDKSIFQLSLIDATTFVISGIFYTKLKMETIEINNSNERKKITHALKNIVEQKNVFGIIISTVLFVSIFQGFHNLSRGALPIKIFNLGKEGVVYLQVLFSAGILLGTFISGRYLLSVSWNKIFKLTLFLPLIIFPIIYLKNVYLSFFLSFFQYFLMALIFEIVFIINYRDLIENTPDEILGEASMVFNNLSTFSMSLSLVIFGYISDEKSFFIGASLMAFTGLLFCLFFYLYYVQKVGRKHGASSFC